MLIFSGRMEPQAVDQEIEKVRGFIEAGKGSVHSVERMGRRRLAYDIRKESDGHYAVFHFEDDPSRIVGLQRSFRLNESILRFMVFRKERFPEGPTVAIEEEEPAREGGYGYRGDRSERSDRPDRAERPDRPEREERPKPPAEVEKPAEEKSEAGEES
jgi:small subunit ribosomal protein S6